ncbi:terminase family protein [Ancylobacter sp. Lp-2]|uniref:terminase large subunit domain-containing protein n=1 Tax=Ancylobacter sp. Lp-2 TaxID=2881339 RepID=UPI001E470826|nr:terminase family protein [Ancylobacter sp. Lp-2]MCB4771056.1 terminase family protein [Ancylobacter sp. Lp-2]
MSLAGDLSDAIDPTRLMTSAGLQPDPWQVEFLRSTAPRYLLLCARQVGKSTVTAALASHVAIYHPNSLVLTLAPSMQQSFEIFRKINSFYHEAETPELDAQSARRIELPNGSRIISLSGNAVTVRGFSAPRLVIVDEAAFADDELFAAVSPMLAGGGRLILLSSPNGKAGFFYEQWANGGAAWARTRVTAEMSSRIPAEFLAVERATKPDRDFRREYLCEFVDVDEQYFGSDLLLRAFESPVEPLFSRPFTWRAPAERVA